jgi:hypothetical protein
LISEGNRVKSLTILGAIIIATPADWRKTDILIHRNRRITVADFQVNALYSFVSCALQEIIEQPAPDPTAMLARQNSKQQQFGFVGHGAEQ